MKDFDEPGTLAPTGLHVGGAKYMSNISSYPPVFRQAGLTPSPLNLPVKPNTIHHHQQHVDVIPIIDMQCLDTAVLDSACRDWGIFRVINHGILTHNLMNCTRRLFNLPFETKRELCSGGTACGAGESDGCKKLQLAYFWGTPVLTPSGEVVPQGPRPVDWVEGFNGLVGDLRRQQQKLPNTIGDEDDSSLIIAEFSNLLREYGDSVTNLAFTLFKSMAQNLRSTDNSSHRISDHHLQNYLDDSTALLRVYRYPPFTNIDHHQHSHQAKGLEAHTDSSVLSILNQDEVGGLEFLKSSSSSSFSNNHEIDDDDNNNNWVWVKPVPGTLLVNLGDMMQAMSGDEYKSVKHRVRLNTSRERLSVCYFVFPEENSCVTSGEFSKGKEKYRDFTYREFREQMQRDVSTTGRKIGLQHFKKKKN